MKRLLSIFVFWAIALSSIAQRFYSDVSTFNPKVGEPFEFVIHIENARFSNLVTPNFEPFRLIGKSTSRTNINGQTSETIVFTLMAMKQGTYKIPSVSAKINGQNMVTQPITVKVGKGRPEFEESPQTQDEPFMALAIESSKPYAYLGEPIEISYVLYANTLGKYSFLDQYLPPPTNVLIKEKIEYTKRDFKPATFKGKNVSKLELIKLIVQPTQVGYLKVPAGAITVELDKNTGNSRPQNPFDLFFNAFTDNSIYRRNVRAEELNIPVKSLPNENIPSGFKGAIGNYSVEAMIADTNVLQGESFSYKMTLYGSGNINILSDYTFPSNDDWDVFKPLVKAEIDDSTGIPMGKIEYVFSIIPKKSGLLKLPAQRFVFFNPDKEKYEVISTPEFEMNVKANESLTLSSDELNSTPTFKSRKGITWNEIAMALISIVLSTGIGFGIWKFIQYRKSRKIAYSSSVALKKLNEIQLADDKYTKLERWLVDILKSKYGADEYYSQLDKVKYLRTKGIEDDKIQIILRIFDQCQAARYAPVSDLQGQELFDLCKKLV
ncbi:MAG TPA: BatD family protein [Bacteroidia bacterium]